MPQSQTSMSEAFVKAGYEPPESLADKLRRLMAAAIVAEGPGRGLRDQSIVRFTAALEAEDDLALMWELFARVRDDVLRDLFAEVFAGVKADKSFGEGDQCRYETQSRIEPSPKGGAAVGTNLTMQPSGLVSPTAVPTPVSQPQQHEPPGHGINGMLLIMKRHQDSWLKRITIGNKPVANMTRDEVAGAIQALPVYSRFLDQIYTAWPPHADNQRVAEWLSDEDGDRLWEKAKDDGHAI